MQPCSLLEGIRHFGETGHLHLALLASSFMQVSSSAYSPTPDNGGNMFPQKCRLISNRLHGDTSHKIVCFRITMVRALIPTLKFLDTNKLLLLEQKSDITAKGKSGNLIPCIAFCTNISCPCANMRADNAPRVSGFRSGVGSCWIASITVPFR